MPLILPLILAVEPDRKQAARIAAMARGPLHAEILVASSAEEALAVLAERIPDLILTSPLMSPREEAALADRLREIDGAGGTRVQTLMIPVLASPQGTPEEARSGLLSRFRQTSGGSATPAGCDPAIFSAQIAEYLERARNECDDRDPHETETAEMKIPELEDPCGAGLLDLRAPMWEEVTLDIDDAEETAARDDDESAAPIELSGEMIDLAAFVSELEAEAELEVHEIHGVHEVREVPEVHEVIEIEPEPPIAAAPAPVAIAHPLSTSPAWPALEGTEADETKRDAVIEDFIAALNETLRQDDTHDLWEEDEPIGDVDPDGDLWMPLPAAAQSSWPPMFGFAVEAGVEGAHHMPRPSQPIQDEWGFFDPEQCGFSALRTRLEEIAK